MLSVYMRQANDDTDSCACGRPMTSPVLGWNGAGVANGRAVRRGWMAQALFSPRTYEVPSVLLCQRTAGAAPAVILGVAAQLWKG